MTGLLNCPVADLLREKYGDMIFRKAKNQKEIVSSEVLDELAREASLENEYSQLQSEAEIAFGKKKLNLSLLVPYLESTDRNVRKEAHRALDVYYQGRRETYDRIFDDLVNVRTQAAQKLGYNTFTELGYKDAIVPQSGLILGPKGMDEDTVKQISEYIKSASTDSTVIDSYKKMNSTLTYYTPSEAADNINNMVKIMKAAHDNIK